MSPSQTEYMEDPLFHGYRERVRALLRHLILERGLCPSSPLVTAYDHHLYLGTAFSEYTRAMEQGGIEAAFFDMRLACFRGCDLKFRYCDRIATSLADQDDDDKPCKQQKDGVSESRT